MAFDIASLQKASLPNVQPTGNTDLARYILTHANVDWSKAANINVPSAPSKGKSPSVLSRILDVMSRPSYAVDEMARRFLEHETTTTDPNTGQQVPLNAAKHSQNLIHEIGDILHGGASGLAGTQKTTWAKTLTELNPNSSPVARYGGGFALDLLTDPTTYVGPGIVKSVIRGGRAVLTGGKALKEGIPESKAVLNVVRGISKVPADTGGAQRLPDAVSRASSQVKIPDFHVPGQVISPKSYKPNFTFDPEFKPATGPLTKLPKLTIPESQHIVEPAFGNNDFKRTAELLAQHYGKLGSSIDVEALAKKLEATPKRLIRPIIRSGELPTKGAEDLNQASKLTPKQIDTIAGGGARKTAQIIGQLGREKGWNINVRALEKTLSNTPKHLYGEYLKQVKDLGVKESGLKAQQEAKALSLGKLQKGAAQRLPMITPRMGVNVERAGTIVDKIASGEYKNFTRPATPPVEIAPSTRFWAERTAKEFEKNVLSKDNKFAKVAGKVPAVNNPAQQANLFLRYANSVAPKLIKGAKNANAKKFMPKRYSEAYKMQKVAEDYYKSKGLHPTFWDGSKVALTDVIDELGGPTKVTQEHMTQLMTAFRNKNPDKIVSPEIRQAIENVRARDALESAKWVKQALDTTTQQASVADQVLSKGKYNDFVKKLMLNSKTTMQMATDASPASINSTQHLLRDILTRQGTLPELATNAKKTYIQLYMTPGSKKVKWLHVQSAQTNALKDVLGSDPAQLGKALDSGNKAESWFLSRFATWYGNKDLRPDVIIQTSGALNNAAARARIWNKVAKTHTPDEISEAWKIAQGHIQSPSSQRVVDLGMQFQKAMENLASSTGVKNEAQKAASVALRSGALIQDLNEQLKIVRSGFRFTQNKAVKDFMGNEHNFSKGTDWLKSWETYETKDPLDHIMRIETAMEQLMHKYAFLDEVGARWGSKLKSGVFSTPVAGRTRIGDNIVGRLDGLYFPKELVPQINKALDTWSQIYDPKSDLIKFFDKVTRAWKSGVTIYAPSHHVRNFIGDTFLSWVAGVNNPHVYTIAGRVLASQRKRYTALETIGDLTDKNALKMALAKPGDKVLTTKGGVDLTAEQVYIAAHSKGLLSHVNVIEDLVGDPLIKAEPFNGKVKDWVHGAAELREHYVRLAHFADALRKSRGSDLPRIFNEAANQVRKWHPDGMDLTKFEREKMKRIFPFYSWTRKTIPLMVEGAVTNPGKINAYPRAMYALQGSLGIQSPSPTDPFPEDQLFPNWIKAKGIGPIMGGAGDYTIVNPSTPFNDLVSQFAGTGKPRDVISGLGSNLTPLARIPMELGTGTTVLGQPVDQDLNRYATEQIPMAAYLSRITNMGIMGPTNKAQKQGNFNSAALLNLLTAMGIQPTAPYIKEAQFEKKKGLQ